jgi:hypothetical protein
MLTATHWKEAGDKYLMFTVLSKIVEPSVAVLMPPTAAASPPPDAPVVAPVAAPPLALFDPFLGKASTVNEDNRKTKTEST